MNNYICDELWVITVLSFRTKHVRLSCLQLLIPVLGNKSANSCEVGMQLLIIICNKYALHSVYLISMKTVSRLILYCIKLLCGRQELCAARRADASAGHLNYWRRGFSRRPTQLRSAQVGIASGACKSTPPPPRG